MSQDELDKEYQAKVPLWGRLEEEAKFILDGALRAQGIKVHSLISRTKGLQSIREKAVRKNVENPLESLEDLVGARVVCLLRADMAKIAQLIGKQFLVVSEDNKIDGSSVEAFGYQSIHFIVELLPSCAGPRYQNLHGIKFEVQVRTLAMDAWAALSHYLDYQSESDVPKDLRKDFFALSGLFYVADTHFELFYRERQKSKDSANKLIAEMPAVGQELNLDTLTAYLHNRYQDRVHAPPASISEVLSELIEWAMRHLMCCIVPWKRQRRHSIITSKTIHLEVGTIQGTSTLALCDCP